MPKFEVDIPHQLPPDEVRTRLDRATAKLEKDYGAACKWEGDAPTSTWWCRARG